MPRSTEPTAHAQSERSRSAGRSGVLTALVALGVFLSGGRAFAEPPAPNPHASEAAPSADNASTSAKIVLIGAVAGDRELALLFDELLGREGVAVEISDAERFDSEALFAPAEAGVTRVFVVCMDGRRARLHFRGPRDERYLLRKVTLSSGLDAVGRELLGQVVQSSVLALLHSTEGLNREQATAELARDDAASSEPIPPVRVKPTSQDETHSSSPSSSSNTPSPWELHLALRYAATWSGQDLGIGHGPGLAVGARYRTGPSMGMELGAERHFAQELSTSAVNAEVQRSSFYGLLEAGITFRREQTAFVAVGPALELSRIHPLGAASGVTLAEPKTELAPSLRCELRYELGAGHWLFGVAALVDVSLVETTYELAEEGHSELLAAPARIRPGAVLTLGVK